MLGVGSLCYAHHRLTGGYDESKPTDATDAHDTPAEEPEECCGQHLVCSKTSLMPDATAVPVYFDDEELDAFQGRDVSSYTPAETEQFRDVLLTLLPDDIPAWARSIQQRGIALPVDVRDELLLMVTEMRVKE